MTIDQIRERTRSFLRNHVGQEIPDDMELFRSGLLNSLFALQLVVFVENSFDVRVENDDLDLENFNSTDAISAFVGRKLARS